MCSAPLSPPFRVAEKPFAASAVTALGETLGEGYRLLLLEKYESRDELGQRF
eukprot:gene10164-10392_t